MALDCPKCRQPTLEPIPEHATPRGVDEAPHVCDRCHGVWVASDDVGRLAGEAGDLLQVEGAHSSPEDTIELDLKGGLCPRGHGVLIRARVEDARPFYLDRCMICAGIWFDRGEFRKVAEKHLLANINDFWTSAWQRQQRSTRSREDHLAWADEVFPEGLSKTLLELAERLRDHPHRSEALAFLRDESDRPPRPVPGAKDADPVDADDSADTDPGDDDDGSDAAAD